MHILASLLPLLFVWAAVAKTLRFRRWSSILGGYGLPLGLARVAAVMVPVLEAASAALILGGRTRAGAALAFALLSAFSFAIVRASSRRGKRLPCGCFGGRGERDYRLLLARNLALLSMPIALLLAGKDFSVFAGWRAPSAGELLPAALVATGAPVALWMFRELSTSFRRGAS